MVYKNFSKYNIDIENGIVYSLVRNKTLVLCKRKDGYISCGLTDDKGNKYDKWHQAVYCITNGITKDELPRHSNGRLYEIDHLNGDRGDNRPENLALKTHKENINNPITRDRFRKFGKDNPNFGKHLSSAAKERISKANSKSIMQIDPITNEVVHIWKSSVEASKNGFCRNSILCCIRGEYKTHKGYKWMFDLI